MSTAEIWSIAQMKILAMLRDGKTLHAYGVCKRTGLKPETVYPILQRFQARGLVHGTTERQSLSGSQPKVFYSITDSGSERLAELRCILVGSSA